MRILSVSADAFGPLVGDRLEFSPGLTVVHGPNESGKSAWHAAIYGGLTGRPDGPHGTHDLPAETPPYLPWSGGDWVVTVHLELDDGRMVVVRQAFDGRNASRAQSVDGDDFSAEIERDGQLDATRWLGLDPESFAATACVAQAQMFAVLGHANGLQELLQRAAATAGAGRTTASVLAAIDDVRRGRSGRQRGEPLRLAIESVRAAEAALDDAKRHRAEYDRNVIASQDTRRRLVLREALASHREARELRTRYERADELHKRVAELLQPPSIVDEDLGRRADTALMAWRDRPPAPPPRPAFAPNALLVMEAGDDEPHPDVVEAAERLDAAKRALALYRGTDLPDELGPADTVDGVDEEFEDLVRTAELEASEGTVYRSTAVVVDGLNPPPARPRDDVNAPTVPPREDVNAPTAAPRDDVNREQFDTPGNRWDDTGQVGLALGAVGGIVAASAIATQALWYLGVGVVVAPIAVLGAIFIAKQRARSAAAPKPSPAPPSTPDTTATLRKSSEDTARLHESESHDILTQEPEPAPAVRETQKEEPRVLSGEPQFSNELPAYARPFDPPQPAVDETLERLLNKVEAARGELRFALSRRHYTAGYGDGEPEATHEKYLTDVRRRAARATVRPDGFDVNAPLGQSPAERARVEAERAVLDAAAACGIDADSAEDAARRLELWRIDHERRLSTRQADAQDAQKRLTEALSGQTLADLKILAETAERRAEERGVGLDRVELEALSHEDGRDPYNASHRDLNARREAEAAERAVRAAADAMTPLVEAEEALERAKQELARVTELDEILAETYDRLSAAQERVHGDIAPSLVSMLRQWLPQLTGQRYVDATVDERTLAIRVLSETGQWFHPRQLSFGTAEQIYLLLRIALISYLTRAGETSPLLLDDVTVHADSSRTEHLLNMLRHLSTSRQIVLFTQQDGVAEWAAAHLPEEARHELERPRVPTGRGR